MNLLDRFRIWRAHHDVARERRQEQRCAAGRHHWKSFADRVLCHDPGCGRWYGQ